MHDSALPAIKREVLRLDFEQQEDELTIKVAVVLMASLLVGTDPQVLANFTHYDRPFIEQIAQRLRSLGVWSGEWGTPESWFQDHALPFWLLVYDAAGI